MNGGNIYYFCNRSAVYQQVKERVCKRLYGQSANEFEEINWLGNIRLFTYQKLENELAETGGFEKVYKKYFQSKDIRYIVLDEFHYFVTDSNFNTRIMLFIEFVKFLKSKHRFCATFLYLSATMDNAIKIYCRLLGIELKNEYAEKKISADVVCRYGRDIWFYRMCPTYFGDKITFFYDYADIPEIIGKDESDEKWLVFIENKDKFRDIKDKIEQFNMKYEYLDSQEAHNKSETYKKIIEHSCFDSKVLVATKVLDVGASLVDDKLKNIVITASDYESIVQMVGRKRRKEGEVMQIYVLKHGQRYFNSILQLKIMPELRFSEYDEVEAFYQANISDGRKEYQNRMHMLHQLFYISDDGTIRKNRMRIFYLQLLKENIYRMFYESERKGVTVEKVFEIDICKWLCIKECDVFYYSNEGKKEQIEEEFRTLIQKYKNEKIDENKKEEFAENIKSILVKNKCGITFRKDRNLGIKKINDIFKKLELEIMVVSRRDSAHRAKSHWEVRECEK